MASPPYVSPGQAITSAWGNDVVATLGDINSRLQTRIRGGYASTTTDTYGDVTVGFGMTFAGPPLIVATITADPTSQPRVIMIHSGGVTTTQFTARIYVAENGGPVVNGPVNINWIAFTGWLH